RFRAFEQRGDAGDCVPLDRLSLNRYGLQAALLVVSVPAAIEASPLAPVGHHSSAARAAVDQTREQRACPASRGLLAFAKLSGSVLSLGDDRFVGVAVDVLPASSLTEIDTIADDGSH